MASGSGSHQAAPVPTALNQSRSQSGDQSHGSTSAPAGGRFKKEIVVDGQSHLLLIRDEGGPPEAQVGTAARETRPIGGVCLSPLTRPVSLCVSSSPCGWTRWCSSSAWKTRSASRRCTTTTAAWPPAGTPQSCRWSWSEHKVQNTPQSTPSSKVSFVNHTVILLNKVALINTLLTSRVTAGKLGHFR